MQSTPPESHPALTPTALNWERDVKREGFSGRIGLVLAALGMAIGTGNIWRFPRVAAEHEGGAFLIPWIIFLFTWSIPILIAEFTLGKVTGRGPIGAFTKLLGRRAAWMGAFMAFTTLMIATYYSVVTGWTLRYVVQALMDMGSAAPELVDAASIKEQHELAKQGFDSFAETPAALGFHLGAVALGALVVWRGIRGGVEVACKILIPLLFIMLIGGTAWVLTQLEGSGAGLEYLFSPKWEKLGSPEIWIAALSQSAWSTGAGWGLILAYGAAAKRNEDAVVTNRTAAMGNNTASLLAALFIFPAVFALLGRAGLNQADILGALKENGSGNTGLAFTYIPFIFKGIPGAAGGWATVGFFVGLFFAALSSLIALYEMSTRVLMDMGFSRGKSVLAVAVIGGGLGSLSALDMNVFISMDWVWGLALVIGGLLVAWAVQTYGADRYRKELINGTGAQRKLGPLFTTLFVFLIPAQGVGLLGWWLYDAATNPDYYGAGNDPWDPTKLGTYGVGPCVIWWTSAAALFWALSPWLGKWSLHGDPEAMNEDDRAPRIPPRIIALGIAALPWVLWFNGAELGDWISNKLGSGEGSWLSNQGWQVMAGGVGLVLIGGFMWNAALAIFGKSAPVSERRFEDSDFIEGRTEIMRDHDGDQQ